MNKIKVIKKSFASLQKSVVVAGVADFILNGCP